MKSRSFGHGSAAIAALVALCAAGVGACSGDPPEKLLPSVGDKSGDDDPTNDQTEQPGAYAGGEHNTFNHMSDLGDSSSRDAFEILAQRQEEGPPEIRTRLHSCQKVPIATLRNILSDFGVDLGSSGDPPTAGQLLRDGTGALGAANYDGRVGEALVWSTAGAAKMFDIFVQAAPEVINNISKVPRCQVGGQGPEMFDMNNQCNQDAISCLMGRPATADHVAACNNAVKTATNPDKGKNIAVATILAAAHQCE